MKLDLKPTQKPVLAYYESLAEFKRHGVSKETSVRAAFADLLKHCARQFKGPEGKWTLIEEYSYPLASGTRGAIDGAILTDLSIPIGYWEAKDLGDDLPKEVKKKFKIGYPQTNILFQTPESAILYQAGAKIGEYDLREATQLIKCLLDFFAGAEEDVQWEEAVENFKTRIKDFGNDLEALIETERKENKRFAEAFSGFANLCRQSINPNLSDKAVEEMLIQHLLTRRIFASVFAQGEFLQRNPIGQEIEKVVHALTTRHFNPTEFFASIEHYYARIESKARDIQNWEEKQQFLNTIYEKFFQGFSVKVADTHGIVYTPQPIVDFMVRSVQHILKTEFNRTLASEGVHILDPFVGTGNFIMRIIREIGATQKSALPRKYKSELHCNEVMLLPYYIASMNIEHEYYRQLGQHEPFDGICLVDTFELAEPAQTSLFSTENTERVERQKKSPIFVIIGNPPYNAWQQDEYDQNKNRRYKVVDDLVDESYKKNSRASLHISLNDPYVKAFRWATNRLKEEGIVAYVSNNSFIDNLAFDGMRAHLFREFQSVYVIDLKGNVRKDSMKDGIPIGEKHTVFGLSAMVGVSIAILVRKKGGSEEQHKIFYADVDFRATRTEKFKWLKGASDLGGISFKELIPDDKNNWLNDDMASGFDSFVPIGIKQREKKADEKIFQVISNGLKTNRDSWVYDFSEQTLTKKVNNLVNYYNDQAAAISATTNRESDYDPSKIKWSDDLRTLAAKGKRLVYNEGHVRYSIYRPFVKKRVYFDRDLNNSVYNLPKIFPSAESENVLICLNDAGSRAPFSPMIVNAIPELHLCATTDGFQCFPFYTYTEDGSTRRENITDWALGEFRAACVAPASPPVPNSPDVAPASPPVPNSPDVAPASPPVPSAVDKKRRGPARTPALQNESLQQGAGEPARTPALQKENALHREINKWDIFYYVYGLLHHPGYRTKYAANLRRELPRIPLPKDAAQFWAFSDAGKRLADLHVGYESAPEYDLKEEWIEGSFDLRVEKMKLGRVSGVGSRVSGGEARPLTRDSSTPSVLSGRTDSAQNDMDRKVKGKKKSDTIPFDTRNPAPDTRPEETRSLIYNEHLTLTGIPAEAFEYRLGNRSALDWIVDQYQVSTDKRSGIANDPNRPDEPDYILRLIKRVTHVSVETVRIVRGIEGLAIE